MQGVSLCCNLVNEYCVRKIRKIAWERQRRIAGLKTRTDAETLCCGFQSGNPGGPGR